MSAIILPFKRPIPTKRTRISAVILPFKRPIPVKHFRIPAAPLAPKKPRGWVVLYRAKKAMIGLDALVERKVASQVLTLIDRAGVKIKDWPFGAPIKLDTVAVHRHDNGTVSIDARLEPKLACQIQVLFEQAGYEVRDDDGIVARNA